MKRIGCAALAMSAAMAVAPGAFAQTDDVEINICVRGGIAYGAADYEKALPDLRACIADERMPELYRALDYGYLVRSLEKLGRIDETIAELRKITAPPWSDMDAFTPPTLAMDKIKEADIYAGLSQPQLILDLASLLSEQGKTDEALVETRRAIHLARTMRADVLAEEAGAWMMYAAFMQQKGDAQGMLAGMIRAYVRGSNHPSLEEYVSQQSPETQAKLKEMRATMMEQRPIFAYRDAWAASLGKRFDPSTDAEGGAALMKFSEVEAEEASLVGPIGF